MGEQQVFTVMPAMVRLWWLNMVFGGIMVLLVGTMFFVRQMVENVVQATFTVADGAVTIRAWPYGRTIPLADLDLAAARVVDQGTDPEARLTWKTNGVGIGTLRAGWWRRKGGGKALVFLTAPGRAVYVPTRQGYALLASMTDPQGFLEALRRAAAGS